MSNLVRCDFQIDMLHYCLAAPKERTVSALHSYKRHQKDLAVCQHQHLKVVKLINFACFKSEFRFALALLQIANSLEKMVIKPGPGKFSFDLMPREPRYLRVRERAKQLEANLPHGAKLLIL
nr:uncharacterized protein LOC113740064 [Coffea arabica]